MQPKSPIYVTSITVKKLFGLYDYKLKQSLTGDDAGKIFLLYGDNGSGKTTILRTLFHLLAPDSQAGHKSEIVKTTFQSFEVRLSNGTTVIAKREAGSLVGSFIIGVKQGRQKYRYFPFTASEDMSIVPSKQSAEERAQTDECLSLLGSLDLALYHLADDRTIELAGRAVMPELRIEYSFPSDEEDILSHIGMIKRRMISKRRPGQLAEALLQQSMERFTSSIKNKVLRASSAGESSVNSLYNEILSRLAKMPTSELRSQVDQKKIQERVRSIEAHSRDLATYGFLPKFSGKELVKQLGSARIPETNAIMAQVLSPYLESWERRIDALAGIHRIVDTFSDIINGFFSNKMLRFDLHDGLSIITDVGTQLSPTSLSSGERHLLLLFCNTVTALHHPSIFIIDEPEISLNIKWQRALISSLCKCIGNNPVQYIFASHSLEIISRYRDRVLKLEDVS